jgi:DNA-binding beta-propeller fold protein YncE
MKITYATMILMLGSALLGCGGGGGGSPPAASGNPPPSGGTPPPAPPPTPPPTSTGISTAEIVFPWQRSSALGATVVVRGTAADPDGVAAVRVNGLGAALTAASGGSQKPAAHQKTALDSVLTAAAGSAVEWSVEVELEPGETELVVAVEDSTGAATAGAAEATIKYAEVPERFTSDPGDPRLLGWSSTLAGTAQSPRLVEFDMSSRRQTIYSELSDFGIASCFRSHTNELVYLILPAQDAWQVRSFNLTTRLTSDVTDVSAQLIAAPGFNGPLLIELVCTGTREHAYLLASYAQTGGPIVKSRVVEVALSGSARILTETDPDETPLWLAHRMTLANDALISSADVSPVAPLTRISLVDGARTTLAPINVGGLAIAAALDEGRVFVTTFDGVDEVLLTDPPSKTNISVLPLTDPLSFSQATSIGLDLPRDRIVVGDSDLDMLIAVDRATGERSELHSRKIGAGPPLIAPRRLALTADGGTLYVADDGGNAAERLFAVDLATGDRRVVGQLHQPPFNRRLSGIALDEDNGYVYVARSDGGGTLLRVDLETEPESVEPITSNDDGVLEGITDILLDAAEHRLLVVDALTDSLVAVDVVTRQKQVLSHASVGQGPAFQTLVSLTRSEDETHVYVGDQATDQILRVNLETGDREVLQTACALGSSQQLQQVLYDADAGELVILSDGVFIHDLETSGCTRVPVMLFPLGIGLTPDGRILAAAFNSVTQIDRESGDVVIVSK